MRPLLVLASVLFALPARAEELGTMTFPRLLVSDGMGGFTTPKVEQRLRIFNFANCSCETKIQIEATIKDAPAAASSTSDNVEFYVGSNCADFATERDTRCEKISEQPVQAFANRLARIEINVAHVVQPNFAVGGVCPAQVRTNNLFGLVDEGSAGSTYEEIWPYSTDGFEIDTEPPPDLTDLGVTGSEDGVVVSWKIPSTRKTDIFGYQILCARLDGSPVFATPPAPEYETPQILCNEGEDTYDTLSPRFVCSGKLSASASSARVDLGGSLLSPKEKIRVKVVVFDEARNARGLDVVGEAGTEPVTDAWEQYEGAGGNAEPGFCRVAPGGHADSGWIVLVLGVAGLVLLRRRGLGLLALLLLVPTLAHAQLYLDDQGPRTEVVVPLPKWAFEFKLGPYRPDIDGEEGLTGRPYEEMFGTRSSILPQIELDRYFLYPAGSLGVGLTLGYTFRSGHSFVEGSDPPVRAGDDTAFHALPIALSAVYRFTYLADNTVVPIVPYAKLGLAYYVWWFTKGGGDLSKTPEGDKAIGATLGWQGTVGISVRADAIDRDGIRDLGVEHIGFFFELTWADVSGFGADTKLHVGDKNWAAGVNFEF